MKQNTSISWPRIQNLFRYDWAIEKNKVGLTLGIILGLYAVLFVMAYWNQVSFGSSHMTPEASEGLVSFAAVSIMNYFEYATMIILIIATTIQHRKFTNPQTAVQYLALPASRLEKYIVMVADYAIVFLSMQAIYFVVYAISMGICQLTYPDVTWWINPFDNLSMADSLYNFTQSAAVSTNGGQPVEAPDVLHSDIMQLFMKLVPVGNLCIFGFWLIVNMLFKHNGILKTIGIFILAYVVLMVIAFITFMGFIAATDGNQETIFAMFHSFVNAAKVILWLQIPLAIFLQWVFYRQIATKQAK